MALIASEEEEKGAKRESASAMNSLLRSAAGKWRSGVGGPAAAAAAAAAALAAAAEAVGGGEVMCGHSGIRSKRARSFASASASASDSPSALDCSAPISVRETPNPKIENPSPCRFEGGVEQEADLALCNGEWWLAAVLGVRLVSTAASLAACAARRPILHGRLDCPPHDGSTRQPHAL